MWHFADTVVQNIFSQNSLKDWCVTRSCMGHAGLAFLGSVLAYGADVTPCFPICFGPSALLLQTVLCKPVTRRISEEVDHLVLIWFFIKWPVSLGYLCTVLYRLNGLEGNRINLRVMAAAVFLPLTLSFSSSSSLNNLSICPFRTTSLSHFDQSLQTVNPTHSLSAVP